MVGVRRYGARLALVALLITPVMVVSSQPAQGASTLCVVGAGHTATPGNNYFTLYVAAGSHFVSSVEWIYTNNIDYLQRGTVDQFAGGGYVYADVSFNDTNTYNSPGSIWATYTC